MCNSVSHCFGGIELIESTHCFGGGGGGGAEDEERALSQLHRRDGGSRWIVGAVECCLVGGDARAMESLFGVRKVGEGHDGPAEEDIPIDIRDTLLLGVSALCSLLTHSVPLLLRPHCFPRCCLHRARVVVLTPRRMARQPQLSLEAVECAAVSPCDAAGQSARRSGEGIC